MRAAAVIAGGLRTVPAPLEELPILVRAGAVLAMLPPDVDKRAERLVHGHTPHTQPHAIELFGGRIVNVDGALSRGFGAEPRGFGHWIEEPEPAGGG